MAMEIKISAIDMLKVLVNAGIDTTDAKAIIFDLLQHPEKAERVNETTVKENKEPVKRGRPKKISNTEISPTAPEEVSKDEENTGEEDDDDEEGDTHIKKPKRINFKNFGGSIDSLPIKG